MTSDRWYESHVKGTDYYMRSSNNIVITKLFDREDVAKLEQWCFDNCHDTWSIANYGPDHQITFRFYSRSEMERFASKFSEELL